MLACNVLQILADAMGLGKTVMTIALILSRPGRGSSEYQNAGSRRAKGGTLIICPMALLSQWKVRQQWSYALKLHLTYKRLLIRIMSTPMLL